MGEDMTNHEKIIFLDIDGVLNSTFGWLMRGRIKDILFDYAYFSNPETPKTDVIYQLDPYSIEVFNHIIKGTQAKVVISSSWRTLMELDKLKEILQYNGLTEECDIIDKTPSLNYNGNLRGNEIYMWMKLNIPNYREFSNYVILDDDTDMLLWHKDHLINTSSTTGLMECHIPRILKILNHGIIDDCLVAREKWEVHAHDRTQFIREYRKYDDNIRALSDHAPVDKLYPVSRVSQ